MNTVTILSENTNEINDFLNKFYKEKTSPIKNNFWEKKFENPIDMIELISTFIDNNEKYLGNIWISLDKDIYICITDENINLIIKYLFERYPY